MMFSISMWVGNLVVGFLLGRIFEARWANMAAVDLRHKRSAVDEKILACDRLMKAIQEVKNHTCEVCKVHPAACIARTNLEKAVEVYQRRANLVFGGEP